MYKTAKLLCRSALSNRIALGLFSRQSYSTMSGKKALIVIAEGSEEIEAVTPMDVLRRAGIEVTVAGLKDANPVVCSRQVSVVPDTSLPQALSNNTYDIIILPGGLKGSELFAESTELGEALKSQEQAGRLVAAICAAPAFALKQHGIGVGKKITSYPSTKDKLVEGGNYNYQEDRVVVDGNLITSRGPGTAMEFSLAIAEQLVGKEKADEVAKGMLVVRQ